MSLNNALAHFEAPCHFRLHGFDTETQHYQASVELPNGATRLLQFAPKALVVPSAFNHTLQSAHACLWIGSSKQLDAFIQQQLSSL